MKLGKKINLHDETIEAYTCVYNCSSCSCSSACASSCSCGVPLPLSSADNSNDNSAISGALNNSHLRDNNKVFVK